MSDKGNSIAPVPLRLIFGAYLVITGYPKLFTSVGHQNIVYQLGQLKIPLPEVVSWGVGSIAFFGGLLLFLGIFVQWAAALNIFSIGGHFLFALMSGQFPSGGYPAPMPPLSGFPYTMPEYGFSLLLMGGLATLILGGAGACSYASWRLRRQFFMTIVASIKPAEEPALRSILKAINDDPLDNPYMQFGRDGITHFARIVILQEQDSDHGPRLIFATSYNGYLEDYVDALAGASPGLDEVWNKCEGYSSADGFLAFVRKYSVPSAVQYFGFPSATVEKVRLMAALRRRMERFLDLPDVSGFLMRPGVKPFLDLLSRFAGRPPWIYRLWVWLSGLPPALVAALRSVLVPPLLDLVQAFGGIGMNYTTFSRVDNTGGDPVAQLQYVAQRQALEDTYNVKNDQPKQNQMTLIAEVRPSRLLRLWLAILAAPLVTVFAYPPGNIANVHTLHSFAFVVLDGGKRLAFLAFFDGSLENYLGDFLDKLIWGLDTFYNNCYDYPEGGMRQVDTFVKWIYERNRAPSVFYSAYPEVTVEHILRDQQVVGPLAAHFDGKAVDGWLRTL
ncbi:MAG TPA: DoxX family membrane protein [Verrucomicrobiae bacterium]|nr:DoxX family membrane protein [Verrucomicrobiae bacterium]